MAAALTPKQGFGQHHHQRTTPTVTQRLAMTPSLRQSLQIMAMRLGDVRRYALEMAAENPFLDVQLPSLPQQRSVDDPGFDFDRISHQQQHPITLARHIIDQINMGFRNPDDRAMALAMVEYLLPVGWLDDRAKPAMAARGLSAKDYERILTRLQQFEPVGVFARNLAECLSLQLADRNLLNDPMKAMLSHLDCLQDGVDVLAKNAGLTQDDVKKGLVLLRQCNPKPGAEFIQDDGDIFHPDLSIVQADGGFTVTVNQGMMPSVRVNQHVKPEDEAGRLLFQKAQEDARMLTRSFARRQDMLLDCGRRLVQHQANYLLHGEVEMSPLSMAALADDMAVHKSTISRIVADKWVDAPKGMIPLADFFSASVAQPDGQFISSRRIMALIRDVLTHEDPQSPLSDQDLVDHLGRGGIIVARRTIAKYRHNAGFLGQSKRRAFGKKNPISSVES